ncbi:APC family permease [Amycolatopsis panacis]|uniref:APC family permease n=1 Tax=Amycolatopsis panacis TaxID=2340917 RepID=A0A419I7J5_9PSEU|nr:APC family permease [Amycolatopsis panacis]RJQ87858.1 APC family permease [Amycolatopsis panacis]
MVSKSRSGKESLVQHGNELLRGSIRFFHVVLMVTAAAAPLVVASAYIPISISSGGGKATAFIYLATTVILLVFTVGYAEMAKRITAAGAFYTYTTQGLGKSAGLGAGFSILAAYSMIAPAILGGFGFYASQLLHQYLGINLAWYWCSLIGLALHVVISYFRVTLTARILGVLLAVEVLVILIVSVATVGQGGAEGQDLGLLSPSSLGGAPAIGIGFFLAFWSWIGFETSAIYSEETADPKKSVPRATYIAVITLGVFYALTAYAGLIGFGSKAEGEAASATSNYFFLLADRYTGHFIHVLMDILVVSSFFACSFAFHNNAARYLFSLGRDKILPSALGKTHRAHKSPYVAIGVQGAVAAITIGLFAFGGADPLLQLGTWLPIFCTLAVIVVQFLVSLAVIGYFGKVGRRSTADHLRTLVAPAIGALAQGVVVFLLWQNISFLAGSDSLVVSLIPLYVGLIVAIGVGYSFWLRKYRRDRYERIGMLREEEDEGDEVAPVPLVEPETSS